MSEPVARITLTKGYGTLVVHEDGALYFLDRNGNQIAQINLFNFESDSEGNCVHADVDVIVEDDRRLVPLAWSGKEGKVLDPRPDNDGTTIFKPDVLLRDSRVVAVDITRR